MEPAQSLTVTEWSNGTVEVDRWPSRIKVSQQLIDSARPEFLRVNEGALEFETTHEYAVYKVRSIDETVGVWDCTFLRGGPKAHRRG